MICVRIKLAGYVQLDSFKMDSRLCNCTMSLVLFQFLAYNEALSFELFRALEIKHWLSASINKIIGILLAILELIHASKPDLRKGCIFRTPI